MAKANIDSATIDFRLDFLLGVAESTCFSVASVWICVSDVLVTGVDLK